MKRKHIFFVAAGIAVLLCAGCEGEEENSSSAENVPESFLKEVFTTDFEERYTEFQKDNDTEKVL